MRVPLLVFALVAMPLAVGAAQGQSAGNANANAANRCKNSPQADQNANSQQGATTSSQAQQHKNCPPPAPPPPPVTPPPPSDTAVVGIHKATGMVFADLDGSGSRDPYAGEMGLQGWTIQLYSEPSGALIATTTTDAEGYFLFSGLFNGTYWVCVVPQTGYMQTWPTMGTGCDGLGYEITLNSNVGAYATNNDFGEFSNPY